MPSSGLTHTQLTSLPTYQSTSSSRLKFLYSDFSRQKQSNPASYSSNVEWWRRTLEAVVLKGWQSTLGNAANLDRLVLHASGPALTEEFRLEGAGKPLGLATVLAELCATKSYFPVSPFLSSTPSIYDAGWLPYRIASYVVGKPLWWALQQLSIVGADDFSGHGGDTERWKKVRGDYVVLSLLERAGDGVLQKQQSKTGVSLSEELYDFDGFKREFAGDALDGVVLSELDVKVLLKYLERDKKAIVVQDEVIKFVQPNQSREITAVDIGVLELKIAVEDLEASVSKIQQQIDDRSEKISAALRQKRKEVALSHLRTKKQFEDLLKKRLTSLETLHSTLLRVEASAGDVEIMKSYESSAATLRAILAHPLLQRDRIDETMDAMASANADARDIDEAIRIGTDVAQAETGIDDAELEAELNALVKDVEGERAKEQEERALQERQEQLDGLTVPEHVARSPERADPSKVVA